MEIKQKDGRINNFLKINSSIEDKNKVLEELVNKSQTLQYVILDIRTRIEYFTVKIKNYIDNTKNSHDLINANNSKFQKNEKEFHSLILEKENILKIIKALEEEEKQINMNKEKKKEEKKNVDNELKITEDMLREKKINEKEINELDKKEIILKRNIEKNENINMGLNNDKKYNENKIQRYLNERENLIEKSKIPKKTKEKYKNQKMK